MSDRVFNYGAGPTMLPRPVIEQIHAEWLDYKGLGISIIELNHRTDMFDEILQGAKALLRELLDVPPEYKIFWSCGGAGMQFSAVPLNLMGLQAEPKAQYCNSGFFATRAIVEAEKFGSIDVVSSSEDSGFDHIPQLTADMVDPGAAYLHITTNNTMMGTRWPHYPTGMPIPVIGDITSEFLSRPIDVSQFGMIYAGSQKNLGPSGITVIIIREDLIGHQMPRVPRHIDYSVLDERDSMPSTPNVFGIYCNKLVLEWVQAQGGPAAMAARNEDKAARIYGVIDRTGFYRGFARKEDRSRQNYTFDLPSKELVSKFLADARDEGLYAIKSPYMRDDVRASLYNAMPMAGAEALAGFMEEFERKNG